MKYFTIKELCCSSSFPRLVEIPQQDSIIYNNLNHLIDNLLDPIREGINRPITVYSGYRPPRLNKAVNGAKNSNHLYGYAADVYCKNPLDMVKKLIELGIDFDECIVEKATLSNGKLTGCKWVHLALKSSNNRRKLLYTTDCRTYHQITKNMI